MVQLEGMEIVLFKLWKHHGIMERVIIISGIRLCDDDPPCAPFAYFAPLSLKSWQLFVQANLEWIEKEQLRTV